MNMLYDVNFKDKVFIYFSNIVDLIIIFLLIYFNIINFSIFYIILLPLMLWAFGSNLVGKIKLLRKIKQTKYKNIKINDIDLHIASASSEGIIESINIENIREININIYGVLGFMNFLKGKGSSIGYNNCFVQLGIINIQTKDYNNYEIIISNIEQFQRAIALKNISFYVNNIETL